MSWDLGPPEPAYFLAQFQEGSVKGLSLLPYDWEFPIMETQRQKRINNILFNVLIAIFFTDKKCKYMKYTNLF